MSSDTCERTCVKYDVGTDTQTTITHSTGNIVATLSRQSPDAKASDVTVLTRLVLRGEPPPTARCKARAHRAALTTRSCFAARAPSAGRVHRARWLLCKRADFTKNPIWPSAPSEGRSTVNASISAKRLVPSLRTSTRIASNGRSTLRTRRCHHTRIAPPYIVIGPNARPSAQVKPWP